MARKKLIILLLAILIGVLLYLFVIPGPVDSVAWTPPAVPPLTGATEANEKLEKAEIVVRDINGPEDVAVDEDGYIYGGTQDGKIYRAKVNEKPELFATTNGRPLGLHFDKLGNLIVCEAWKGLLSINKKGIITTLCSEAEGIPFAFTNDLDIAKNGTIYFSDASSRFNQPDYMLDALEARPWGRLLRYDPKSKEVTVLAKDLYFANGVALSKNEDFLIVNETWRYRTLRYWLKGPKKGKLEVFAKDLPGFPDGAASDRTGTFWIALPTLRNTFLDSMHPNPLKKNIVAKLPKFMKPKPKRYGLIIAINEEGKIVRSLHDIDGNHVSQITSVQPHKGWLYLGTLHGERIGRVRP